MKKALIVGHTGQDGFYLYKHLEEQGYVVLGVARQKIKTNSSKSFKAISIHDALEVYRLLTDFKPDEVYYLAARHHSSQDTIVNDAELFKESFNVHVLSLINFLEGIRNFSKQSRLFYAASAHIFGDNPPAPQDENTAFNPVCVYGITKAAGLETCRFYHRQHGVYASVGILYNHESPRRSAGFLSRKVVEAARAIKNNQMSELVIGNLNSEVDWGYAPDYVEAMAKILQLPSPNDFIIASAQTHSVRDFIKGVFDYLGLSWEKYVREDPGLITKKAKANLCGNNQKLKKMTGWEPRVRFNELIKVLVDAP